MPFLAFLNDEEGAEKIEDLLNQSATGDVSVSEQVFREAARLKVIHKISLADCIGLATAIEHSGQFVSSDHHELETIASNLRSANKPSLILWFR